MLGTLLTGLLIIILLIYLKDIGDLKIAALIRKSDIAIMIVLISTILGITLVIAQVLLHYVIGILGCLIIILEFKRRGITAKGIIVAAELNIFGYWNRLHAVEITKKNIVKVVIYRNSFLREEIHYYRIEDYENVVTTFLTHLPKEHVKITTTKNKK